MYVHIVKNTPLGLQLTTLKAQNIYSNKFGYEFLVNMFVHYKSPFI